MRRSRAKLFCVVICVASALLCALSRAPMLAAMQGLAAVLIWRLRFGQTLEANDFDRLVIALRDARSGDQPRINMIRATALTSVIAVASSAKRLMQFALAFRDEMTVDQWRQMSTALRHQPRRALPSMLARKKRGK